MIGIAVAFFALFCFSVPLLYMVWEFRKADQKRADLKKKHK
ncbi:hypothetical protein HHE01_00140 [Helicobacter heilmannii]|uniref:Uncharacterized protein n=1 Tax=Helicobacter heilmannii TaxID=35817 RepID=A0A0K2YEE4_HELHE|nr:hypothetical protein BN341_p160 [Helicobacter heilmannii ASB1.4]CRI35350.1 hypothetical protein HHE01_00140 [Helicobacter heilmannii]